MGAAHQEARHQRRLKRHLLLTGVPGSGKSTAIRELAKLVDHPHGFYTAEIRKGGQRVGFRLVTFAGEKAVIAHVGLPKTYRVSKYGVDVAAVDQASDALLNPGATLYPVDEIGKMECVSQRFVERMKELLDSKSTVVATVASRGEGFIAEVKRRPDCELWTLTRANRDAMPMGMRDWLQKLRP